MSFWNGRKMMNALLAGQMGQMSMNLLVLFWLIAAAIYHIPLAGLGAEEFTIGMLKFIAFNLVAMGIYAVLFINSHDGRKILPAAWVGLTFPVIFRGVALISIAYGLVSISLVTGYRVDLASKFLMDPRIPLIVAGAALVYMVIYAHSCLRPVHNWKRLNTSPLPAEKRIKRKTGHARLSRKVTVRSRSFLLHKGRKNLLSSRI